MSEIVVVGPDRAAEVLAVVHEAFAARPPLDPPAAALRETEESIAKALAGSGGLLATVAGRPVGTLIFEDDGSWLWLRRVGVLPGAQHHGVGPELAEAAVAEARRRGAAGLRLVARAELPRTVRFWRHRGFVEIGQEGPSLTMVRLLPAVRVLPTAEDTRALGARLAALLRAGDVVILDGELGAGKTTLTQGIGDGLGVRGGVTSPTFVIARVHPSQAGGPALVHVDAYRLGDQAELDDLDLDTELDDAVTVVEWGSGLAEALAGDRIELRLERAEDDVRTLTLAPVGARWAADLRWSAL